MFVNAVLIIFGLGFGVFGVWALLAPQSLAQLLHFGLQTPGAVTEMRAFYGGLELGLAGLLLAAVVVRSLVPGALLALTVAAGGIAIGRLIGLALDGSGSGLMFGALAFELAGGVFGLLAYRSFGPAVLS